MKIIPGCRCSICGVEHTLLQQLKDEKNAKLYRDLTCGSSALSGFQTALALSDRLDVSANDESWVVVDGILRELLQNVQTDGRELRQLLVLLILIPALHKTSRQIAAGFPSLARDDIAQHLLTTVLEIVQSRLMLSQESHFAFTITRLLRRKSFRWAIRESKLASQEPQTSSEREVTLNSCSSSQTSALLREFLEGCLSNGLLTEAEHELLMLFKVHGLSSEALAAREGLSDVAFRHRVQRIIDRLRRVAQMQSKISKRRPVATIGRAPRLPRRRPAA